jgi:type IV secretory pathway component VirB8
MAAVLDKLDERPDWKDVRTIEAGLKERIQKLEDWQKWAIRAVLLAVLGAVAAALQIVGTR